MLEDQPLKLEDLLSEGKLDFQWLARQMVHGFQFGAHRSPFRGTGHEFLNRREYLPGDPLKFVDWKYWARSDQWFVKEFHRETNRACYLFLDQSASMDFGEGSLNKWLYARALVACLVATLEQARDAVSLQLFQKDDFEGSKQNSPQSSSDAPESEFIRSAIESSRTPSARPDHYDTLFMALEHLRTFSAIRPETALSDPTEWAPQKGLSVLVTDGFLPLDSLLKWCGDLKSIEHEVAVFHILNPDEWDPPASGEFALEELETGAELELEWASVRDGYLKKRDTAIQKLEEGLRQEEVDYCRILTNEPLSDALRRFFEVRDLY